MRRIHAGLALVLLVSGAAMVETARRTSATFDEIVLVAAGLRTLETGDRSLLLDQPPLMPLLYGAAAGWADPSLPLATRPLGYDDRWNYARALYFDSGNDPERLALLSRAVGIACALALVVAVFAFTRGAAGPAAALVAAALVAFLPDVLAHAAVAYNDLPLALAYFGGLVALDAFVRRPGAVSGAVAGGAVALALGIKFSALALGPVAGVLLAAEAAGRGGDRAWWRAVAGGAGTGVLAAWAVTALLYGGDLALEGLRIGYYMTVQHAAQGHPAPAYLLGSTSAEGWWWFFPVAFVLKTPAAFHLLLAAAVAAALPVLVGTRGRALLASPLRAPLAGALVFAAFLMSSSLNAGFRYALPALPPLAALAGAGVARLWRGRGRAVRVGLAALVALHVGSTLGARPWYLAYVSEWAGPRRPADPVLLDSSLDWGQGLLALRGWMEEEGVERVSLSYFGSALPAGYGIRYRALPSFLDLPEDPVPAAGRPRWTAISATNLRGLYFGGEDPFAAYRLRTPHTVLAGSILLFDDGAGAP